MLMSMTGFGSKQAKMPSMGKISVELRSTNHKALDIVFHLPEGFLPLEDKIKTTIEAKIKRGRVTCAVALVDQDTPSVFVNEPILKKHIESLKKIQRRFNIKGELQLDTLIHLPGVLSVTQSRLPKERIWPQLSPLVNKAVDDLLRVRQKEGRATALYLRGRARVISYNVERIRAQFKKLVAERCKQLDSDEERVSFLKEADIGEELERLSYHVSNFKTKLATRGPVGKELDFIAQEMQREANTMGAKSFNGAIASRVVQMKSQIEKIREQVQNIE